LRADRAITQHGPEYQTSSDDPKKNEDIRKILGKLSEVLKIGPHSNSGI